MVSEKRPSAEALFQHEWQEIQGTGPEAKAGVHE